MKLKELTTKYLGALGFTIFCSTLLFSPQTAFGIGVTNLSDESLYRYNALENKNSVTYLFTAPNTDIPVSVVEKNSEEKITRQIGEITEKQNYLKKQADGVIEEIESGSEVGKFLIGTNLGMLRFQLVQIRDQIYQLEQITNQTDYVGAKTQIMDEVKLANEEQLKIEDFILMQEKRFSLFGWFVKIL